MGGLITYTWVADKPSIITVKAGPTAKIKAAYKTRGSSVALQEISAEPIYRSDDVWEIATQFPVGEYYIRLTVTIDSYSKTLESILKVVPLDDYSSKALIETLIERIALLEEDNEILLQAVKSKLNLKTVG